MYEINRDGIEKIITSSLFSENEDTNKSIKNSLLAVMNELCDYTSKVNKKVVSDSQGSDYENRIGDIYVSLLENADETEYEAAGLYKMSDTNPYRVFLDCEYDDIKNIVGDLSGRKIFKGKYIKDGVESTFDYSLEFDDSFLKVQEKMFEFSEQYRVKNPMIFSPYSHKSFLLKYDMNFSDNCELDFRFHDNCIPVLAGDYCLYWNIKQKFEKEKTYDAKEPYGDKTKYIYSFKKTKKGKYLLPLPLNNQTCVFDIRFIESGVEIITDHDIDDFILLEYAELDFNSQIVKERQSKNFLFDNIVSEKQRFQRILSEGDIERVIGYFRDWKEVSCKRAGGEGKRIIRYSKKYRADRKDKNMFNSIKREYISFKKSNDKFLTDYANYILEYLEYYYPEIEWAGEE